MCPVIENADLSSVSTTREVLPDFENYLLTLVEQEYDPKKQIIFKLRVDEPEEVNGVHVQGRVHWEYINLVQNDGKPNKIGWTTIKRYLEAVFGKGSDEAEASPPDTDVLTGHQVRAHLIVSEYKPKNWKDGEPLSKKNEIKRLWEA